MRIELTSIPRARDASVAYRKPPTVGCPSGDKASQGWIIDTNPPKATTAMKPGTRYAMTSPKFRAESSPTTQELNLHEKRSSQPHRHL